MLRKFLWVGSSVSGALLSAAPVVTPSPPPAPAQAEDSKGDPPLVCRPSELPIYPKPVSTVSKVDIEDESEVEKTLMVPISTVRSTVQTAVEQVSSISKQVSKTITDSTDQFTFVVSYLREEDNEAQRIGATAMGTLTGLIFGLRGGIVKKAVYGLAGTAAMGSICYPEQASVYWNHSVAEGKHLAQVLYNFAAGVKPGEEAPINFFSDVKIPSNFSELTEMATSFWKDSNQDKEEGGGGDDKPKSS